MKVFAGSICGEKQQSTKFVTTGLAKGSYPIHVCTVPVEEGRAHKGRHYDSVHKVHF